ncbi:MAG: sugar ABC transporter substrate-binding protein [Lachnospiraceae bacterium]|nr:sugar ABC transporter substrate-binding protein [Lachnospiraceae bacterium]
MKRRIALFLAAIMLIGMIAGCSSSQNTPSSTEPEQGQAEEPAKTEDTGEEQAEAEGEKKEINVGFSFATQEGSFWQAIQVYTDLAAKEYGEANGIKINITYTIADNDAGKQQTDIKDLIATNPDVIVMAPMDSSAILASIKECHDAGIPVITTSRQENPEATGDQRADVFVGLDTTDQAYTTGITTIDRMIEDGYKPEDIHPINMVGDLADENAVNRSNGFKKAMEEKGVTIVQEIPFEWDTEKCLSLLSAALVAHPEVNCIFIPSDSHLASAQAAMERNNMWHKYGEEGYVYLCSQDGSIEGLPYVQDGYCIACTSYDHWPVCVKVVEEIVTLANGGTPENAVEMMSGRVVTPENISTLENLWGIDLAN